MCATARGSPEPPASAPEHTGNTAHGPQRPKDANDRLRAGLPLDPGAVTPIATPPGPSADYVQEGRRTVKEAKRSAEPALDLDTAAPILADTAVEAMFARRAAGEERSIPLPWRCLTEPLGGGLRQGLHVITGPTATGKTALALQVALCAAREGGARLYVGLELDTAQIHTRLRALLLTDEDPAHPVQWSDIYLRARSRARRAGREGRASSRRVADPHRGGAARGLEPFDAARAGASDPNRAPRRSRDRDPRLSPAYRVGSRRSLRRELFALRPGDVDLAHRTLTLSRSHDGSTKSGKSRVVPIPAELVPFLEDSLNRARGGLLFPSLTGGMLSRNTDLAPVLRRALVRAKAIDHWSLRCRRKTCGYREDSPSSASRSCPKCGFALWPIAVPPDLQFRTCARPGAPSPARPRATSASRKRALDTPTRR
jgi:hypothetical protein